MVSTRIDPIAFHSLNDGARVCVQSPQGVMNYQELHDRSNQIAFFLTRHLSLGQHVALYFSGNRQELFPITNGAKRGGFGYTNFYSHLSAADLLDKITSNRYRVLFVDKASLKLLASSLTHLRALSCIVVDIDNGQQEGVISYSEICNHVMLALNGGIRPPGSPVMLTSGTTGPSKLVSIQRGMSLDNRNSFLEIGPKDVNLVVGRLYHGGAYAWAKGHLNRQAKVVIPNQEVSFPDSDFARLTVETIQKNNVTNFWISPTWLQGLCEYIDSSPESIPFPSLRAIIVGAAHFHPALREQVDRCFGQKAWVNYAITEFGLVTALSPQELLSKPLSVGKPVSDVTIEIRDDSGTKLENGSVGEIFIRNRYTNGCFYSSEDTGYLDDDGYLTVLGRKDEWQAWGENLKYARLIEDALFRRAEVKDCYVIETDISPMTVFIVFRENFSMNLMSIKEYLKKIYPDLPLELLRGLSVSSLPRRPYKVNRGLLKEMTTGGREL